MIVTFYITISMAVHVLVRHMNDVWREYTSDVIIFPNLVYIYRSVNSTINIIC